MSLDGEDERPQRPLLLTGAVGAVLAALLGMLAPYGGAFWQIPAQLDARVSEALIATGYPGVEVEMRGQSAHLSGVVEREEDIAAAERTALSAAGLGGAWAGGVTKVDASGVSVGMMEHPYAWSAVREQARVVLEGATPSQAAREAIYVAARQAFTNTELVNHMRVAGGAPSPHFTDVASDAVRLLARLNSGQVRIIDAQIAVIGDGDQEAVDALRARLGTPPAPFRSRLAVTIDGLDVEHPELQGLNLASGDAETCEHAFERLMERNVINFAPGSAAIEPSSRDVLDALASVALRCDRFVIEVEGHTDNEGGREMNMQLSQQRADAVATYLIAQGVARERLDARGYGPDRPRASNANETGRAANRRIEFSVSG